MTLVDYVAVSCVLEVTSVEFVVVSYERSRDVTRCDNSVDRFASCGGRAPAEYVVVSREEIYCAVAEGLRLSTSQVSMIASLCFW